MSKKRIFTVCIVGRPNVGKSTLFNKLTGTRRAIVDDMPGVTRDRMFRETELSGVRTLLIDTGGIEPEQMDIIGSQVREQALLAVEEADVVCYVADGREGMTGVDRQITSVLRKSQKRIVVAVNKMDNPKQAPDLAEFWALGFDEVIGVSAEHSHGFGDLCDALVKDVPEELRYAAEEPEGPVESPFTVAVVGRPNVGKSSLINRILGEKRLMVSEIAGTTRDAVDTDVRWHGEEFTFIDTAGIRRKNRISLKLEKYSVIMSLKSIERAELALLVLDATQGITVQDERVAGLINEQYRACILVVNKWDLVEKDTLTAAKFQKDLDERLKFIGWAPAVFVSAETGQRMHKIFETIREVKEQYRRHVDTGPLNRKLDFWTSRQPPPIVGGHRVKFYYLTQNRTAPPSFVFFVSRPDAVLEPYRRFLSNRIRDEYGFSGAPIKLIFERRTGRHSDGGPKPRHKPSATVGHKPRGEAAPKQRTDKKRAPAGGKKTARMSRRPGSKKGPHGK